MSHSIAFWFTFLQQKNIRVIIRGLRAVSDFEYELQMGCCGKGSPLIYINGRKLRDIAELDQLTSEEIKSVEVVRNPGARYDATVGRSFKQYPYCQTTRRWIWSEVLRSSYDQSQNSDFVEQADVNYRHNGLDVFAMVRFDKTTSLQNDILEQAAFTDTIWTQRIISYRFSQYRRTHRIQFMILMASIIP